jgi:hypothetical protein
VRTHHDQRSTAIFTFIPAVGFAVGAGVPGVIGFAVVGAFVGGGDPLVGLFVGILCYQRSEVSKNILHRVQANFALPTLTV